MWSGSFPLDLFWRTWSRRGSGLEHDTPQKEKYNTWPEDWHTHTQNAHSHVQHTMLNITCHTFLSLSPPPLLIALVDCSLPHHFLPNDVLAPAWPESPGFGLALGGLGFVKSQARPKAKRLAYHPYINFQWAPSTNNDTKHHPITVVFYVINLPWGCLGGG